MSRLGIFGSKEKLKSILQDIVIKYYGVNEALEEVLSERKKWAISKKPKEKELLKTNPLSNDIIYQTNHEAEIYNQALADYVKKIEEG